jgi:putative ABC transport system permease protein
MKIGATIRVAFRALRRNKMRSALTMLGIVIGVAAVITSVGIGNGAKSQVEAQIATLGENMVLIFSGSFSPGGVRGGWGGAGLKIDDAVSVAREVPGIVGVSPEIRSWSQIMAGNQNWYTQLLGESPEYFDMRQWPLVEGTVFEEAEVKSAAKVAVIGQTAASMLFGDDSPVGKIIRVKNVPFTVIGLLKAKGMNLNGSDQDDLVIVPYTTAMKRLTGDTRLRQINAQVSDEKLSDQVQVQITSLLRQRHHITPGHDDDFTVRSQQDIAEMATATSKVLGMLLACVACVSLIVGGIGIMNIMLVSVTERTREIGIRIAVGAHGRDILMQFLIEAVALSSLGGLIGIGGGLWASELIHQKLGWPTSTPVMWIGGAFGFSAVVGILFGLYPAWKASKLDPIDALRYE